MSTRHRTYAPLDTAPLRAGDRVFYGVDESLHPALLPEGMVASATNKRFVKGQAEDRPGHRVLPLGPSNGAFDVSAGAVRGAGVYSQPNGEEWWLVAAAGNVYRCRPNNQAVAIPLNGATLSADCAFTQGNEQLLLGRGFDAVPLRLKTFDAGFEAVTQETSGADSGTGTLPIPNFRYAAYLQNRLIAVGDQDIGYVSDIRNLTRYSVLNAFRINTGDADELLRVVPFGDNTVICFKTQSIYPVTGLTPDTNGDWTSALLGDITRTHGLAAAQAVVQVGADLWYLGTGGRLTSIRLTEQSKLQLRDVPLTDRMRETMKRVNQAYLDRSILLYLNNKNDSKLFLFLPLDDARVLGDDVLPAAAQYVSGTYTLNGLTAGQRYLYTQDAFDYTLVNGTETLSGSGVFTAQGTSATLTGVSGRLGATVQPLKYEGVLNACLVYDFNAPSLAGQDVPGQWMGVDEADAMCVHSAWIGTYQGQPRVLSLGHDGVLRVHEEGFEDEVLASVATPYADLMVHGTVAVGQTVQVNGGTGVTAIDLTANTGTQWGCHSTAGARTNLWSRGIALEGGYDPTSPGTPWTCPNATPTQIDYGVRFTATNGTVPEVKINGSPATGYAGASNWAYIDSHSGVEITEVPIESELVTRGYLGNEPGRKTFTQAKLALATWNPTLTVETIVDGVNETGTALSALTKDPTAFTTWAKAAYDPANPNDDAADPYREDYSLALPALGTALGSGAYTDLLQDAEEPVRLGERGRYLQLRLTNTTGRCTLRELTLEAIPVDRSLASKT